MLCIDYARYLSVYYADMTNLPSQYPEVCQELLNGNFSVQLSNTNPFGCLPVDQATEVSVNKDTQTPGGTTRFDLNSGAVKQYYITAEHRSVFLHQLRDTIQSSRFKVPHADLQSTRAQKDEKAICTFVSLIQSWVNPFKETQTLVGISTTWI